MKQQSEQLEQWILRLCERDMPVLAHTARQVAGISAQNETSVAALSQVVLLDSAMTARLLRLANSVYYNPGSSRISTVSRAIVMLGFETVRTIALSIVMVDTFLRGRRQAQVIREMAEAFHAAVQAKSFAAAKGIGSSEEIFIATLLYRLGYMAFWCFADERGEVLELRFQAGANPGRAEREVLGFTLNELTAALNQEWQLSELLAVALASKPPRDGRVSALELGVALARAVGDAGWNAARTSEVIAQIAKYTDESVDAATRRVHANARAAIKAANDFGVVVASKYIPLPSDENGARVDADRGDGAERQSSAEFQLRILRELSAMLAERVDINALLGMVLEGIYRGVDTDHAVFAIISNDGSCLKAKYVLGEGTEAWLDTFTFPLGPTHHHVFARILESGQPLWLSKSSRQWRQYLTPEITRCIGETDFFAMPLAVGGKVKGLFYADRHNSRRPLDAASYESFRHFCEQALIAFAVLGARQLSPA